MTLSAVVGGVQLTTIELVNERTRSEVGSPGTEDSIGTKNSKESVF